MMRAMFLCAVALLPPAAYAVTLTIELLASGLAAIGMMRRQFSSARR